MAKVEKLVKTIIKWEAGVMPIEGESEEEMFERAKAKGYANDPVDAGGPTMVGVTIGTYRAYARKKGSRVPDIEDLKRISYTEWLDILKTMFWDKVKADEIKSQSIANLCVNTVWGSGASYIKVIQKTAGAYPDGIIGPKSLEVINSQDPRVLFNKLWNRRKKFFLDIVKADVKRYEVKIGREATEYEKKKYTKYRFLNGWLNRLNDFQFTD